MHLQHTHTHTHKDTHRHEHIHTYTNTQSELDDAFGDEFDPFKEVLGHVHSDKKESQIKKVRSLTLDEMRQQRELELMAKQQQKRASFTDLMGDSPLPVPKSGKRTSFTDLMGDSPLPVPKSGKRTSFTDIADGDFDAGFFDGTPSPTTNKFIEETSDAESSSSSSSEEEEEEEELHEVDKKRVVVVKVKVPRYAKAGQFVNVRRRRSLVKNSH